MKVMVHNFLDGKVRVVVRVEYEIELGAREYEDVGDVNVRSIEVQLFPPK